MLSGTKSVYDAVLFRAVPSMGRRDHDHPGAQTPVTSRARPERRSVTWAAVMMTCRGHNLVGLAPNDTKGVVILTGDSPCMDPVCQALTYAVVSCWSWPRVSH